MPKRASETTTKRPESPESPETVKLNDDIEHFKRMLTAYGKDPRMRSCCLRQIKRCKVELGEEEEDEEE